MPTHKLRIWKRLKLTALVTLASIAAHGGAYAGEIAGLPPQLPTFLERDLHVTFINDFLGRGGSVDDYRTQQSVISATVADRWIIVLDHSLLTLSDEPSSGRIDQLSVSLGYELMRSDRDGETDELMIGTGLRSVGRFAGERIQNGFHRLVGSGIEELDYVGKTGTDLSVWFDAQRYRMLRDSSDDGLLNSWRMGYQIRAASLATSAGQWDSVLSVQAVISRPTVDVWLGIRSDWRSGYDDAVLRETASAEDDMALVLGARLGPLVIETVQQFNNKASYGQIQLVSSASDAHSYGKSRLGLDLGVLLPEVQLRLAARLPMRLLTSERSRWRESLLIGLGYGKPQYKNNTAMFTRSRQIDAGIELERPLSDDSNWLSTYVAAGAGWRDERLTREGEFQDESSATFGRVVITASAGVRASLWSYMDRWRLRLQLGLVGRVPVEDATAAITDQSFEVQRSAVDLMFAATLDFE